MDTSHCRNTRLVPRLPCLVILLLASGPVFGASLELARGWQSYGGGYQVPGAVRAGRLCVLSGLVRSAARRAPGRAVQIARLSEDCRPAERLIFNQNNHTARARVDVDADGRVIWQSGFAQQWVSLDGIRFAAGPRPPVSLPLARSWRNYGSPYQGASYVNDDGLCVVAGLVRPNTRLRLPAEVLTLPASCRPAGRHIFNLHANSHDPGTRVDVLADGRVVLQQGGMRGWLSLSGIAFAAAPGSKLARVRAGAKQAPLRLDNGWRNYGRGHQPATLRDANGLCALSGLIRGDRYERLAILPPGCRPSQRLIFNALANSYDQTTRIDVFPDGQVRWIAGGRGGWISLAGIAFSAGRSISPRTAMGAAEAIRQAANGAAGAGHAAPRVAGAAPRLATTPVLVDEPGGLRTREAHFDGFIYPLSDTGESVSPRLGPALPGPAGPGFELDAPLATLADPEVQYYAFGVSVRVSTPGEPVLEWVTGAFQAPVNSAHERRSTDLVRVPGPCTADPRRRHQFMHEVALRNTGLRSWAAYDARTDAMLAQGRGLFWVTCRPGARNPATEGSERIYHLAVLLPARLVPHRPGGTLAIRTLHQAPAAAPAPADPTRRAAARLSPRSRVPAPSTTVPPGEPVRSPPLTLNLMASPLYVAVVGDSVAWGQGLRDQEKYFSRFERFVAQTTGSPVRTLLFAHSGAQTGWFDAIGTPRLPHVPQAVWDAAHRPDIAFAHAQLDGPDDFCDRDRDFNGEVNRKHPTTQCQVAHSSRLNCVIRAGEGAGTTLRCLPDLPRDDADRTGRFLTGRRAHPDNVTPLDIRARYDFVLLSSCINDVGATDILTDFGDAGSLVSGEHLDVLQREVRRRCDLRNGLIDLRTFYPNAAVLVTGYHRYVSRDTFFHMCYENPGDLTIEERWLRVALMEDSLGRGGPLLRRVGGRLDATVGALLSSLDRAIEQAPEDVVSARVSAFLAAERESRRASVEVLNANASVRGRGFVMHVPVGWADNEAVFAPRHKVFGLTCSFDRDAAGDRESSFQSLLTQANPEDSLEIRQMRETACGEYKFATNDAPDATDLAEQVCVRASVGHPDAAGAEKIFGELRQAFDFARLGAARESGLPLRRR